jgi:hypothetical protein
MLSADHTCFQYSRLCSGPTLLSLLQQGHAQLLRDPKTTALVVGSGTGALPEQLYDRQAQRLVPWRAREGAGANASLEIFSFLKLTCH